MGKPRGQSERAHRLTIRRQAASLVERAQPMQKRLRFGEGRFRWLIKKIERCRIGHTPCGGIEHEAGQVSLQNLRRRESGKRSRLPLMPQANGNAGFGSPGTARALIRACARCSHGFKPGEAGGRFIFGQAGKPAVNHHPHAIDRDGRFGNRGRQHDLAATRRRGPDCRILCAAFHRSIKRRKQDIGRQPFFQKPCRAFYLALPRQEGQNTARFIHQCIADCPRHGILNPLIRLAVAIADIDGISAALALDDRRIAEKRGHARTIQRCRHDEDFEIVAQCRLHIERQRQTEIGIKAAFMKFIKENGGNAIQVRIIQDHARKDALGDDKNSGFGRYLAFKAHPVADRFTRLFTQKLRHAAGGSAGSKPPWLQKHDHAFPAPVRTQHMERHQRRFARTRRRNKDRACMMRQCLIKLRQNSCHGKIGQARQRLSIFCIVRFGGLHERCGIVQPSGPVDVLPQSI